MKNSWNQFIYACWSPVYDRLIGIRPFVRSRRLAIELLELQPGQRLLIVGIGTGADLPLLPHGVEVVGIDISRAMLWKAASKVTDSRSPITLVVGDAANLPFPEDEYDAVLLSLILSVVPDDRACLAEVRRVSRPDSRIIVFDKFLHKPVPSVWRRMANVVTKLFGTDINRRLEEVLPAAGLQVILRQPAAFGGAYELIGLRHESC